MSISSLFTPNSYRLKCNQVEISSTISATNTNSGALIINGGVSVSKNIIVGSDLSGTSSTGITLYNGTSNGATFTTDTDGQPIIRGAGTSRLNADGVLSFGNLTVTYPGNYTLASEIQSLDDGSLQLSSYHNITHLADDVRVESTTVATSTDTGALIVAGGVGINGSLYTFDHIFAGKNITCNNNAYIGLGLYLPTSGGTAAPLSYYESSYSSPFSYPLGGALSSINLTGYYTQLNKLVTISIHAVFGPAASNNTIFTGNGSIPSKYRPSGNLYFSIIVLDNYQILQGCCQLSASGYIIFYVGSTSPFTYAGNLGVYATALTYSL